VKEESAKAEQVSQAQEEAKTEYKQEKVEEEVRVAKKSIKERL
jgi:hypothetical protein